MMIVVTTRNLAALCWFIFISSYSLIKVITNL
jgi:hypothetical protein